MNPIQPSARVPFLLFAALTTCVYVISATLLVPRLQGFSDPDIMALAVTADIALIVPAGFYFLVVRPNRLSAASLVPVLILSVLIAMRVIPEEQRHVVRPFELALMLVEIGFFAWLMKKAVGGLRRTRNNDPVARFEQATAQLISNRRLRRFVVFELSMLYYAFGSWKSEPHVPEGASSFTHHERSGRSGALLGFLILLLIETPAVHLLLHTWNTYVAWAMTLSSVYFAIWMVGDYRATVLRPILIDQQSIHVRAGFRFDLKVPLSEVAAIESTPTAKPSHNLVGLGEPTHWITFDSVKPGLGLGGLRRPVGSVGIEPDNPKSFVECLEEARRHRD